MNKIFKRRQDKFVILIIEQATLTLKGLDLLKEYMDKQTAETAQQITSAEKEADEVRRILIDELNRTFITPFDREDIFALSRAIDDMLDYGYSTVDEMEILKVKPTGHMLRIASLLRDAAAEIHLATQRLEHHPGVAAEHAQRGDRTRVEIAPAVDHVIRGVDRKAQDLGIRRRALRHGRRGL